MNLSRVFGQAGFHAVVVVWFFFLLYLLVSLALACLMRHRKSLSRLRSDLLLCAAVLLVALANRILVADHVFFHDNNQGYQFLQKMLNIFGESSYRIEYGVGGFAFHSLLLRMFGGYEKTVFFSNSVLGALTCTLAYGVVRINWESRTLAFWSALILAILPAHIKISGTEILYIGGAFWGTMSLLLASWVARKQRCDLEDFLLLPLAAAITVQFRETLNLYFLVLTFYLLAFSRNRSGHTRRFIAWFLVLSLPHIVFYAVYSIAHLTGNYGYLLTNVDNAMASMFSNANILIDGNITPPLLTGLFLVGLLRCLWRMEGKAIFFAGTIVLFSSVAFMKTISGSNRVMFHVHYQTFVAIITAHGLIAALDAVGALGRKRIADYCVSGALLVYFLSIPLFYRGFIQYQKNIQVVYHFLDSHMAGISPTCRMVTLSRIDTGEREPVIPFPFYYERFRKKEVLSIRDFLSRSDEVLGNEKCVTYFESPVCHLATLTLDQLDLPVRERNNFVSIKRAVKTFGRGGFGGTREVCALMDQTFNMAPMDVLTFANLPDDIAPLEPKTLRVGFYRVLGRKTGSHGM